MTTITNDRRLYTQNLCLLLCVVLVTACSYSSSKDDYYAIAKKPEHKLVKSELWILENEAKKGNPTAMYKLSQWEYVNNDYKYSRLSYEWGKKAAELGLEVAMLGLGFDYLRGNGTDRNIENAFYWLSIEVQLSEEGDLFAKKGINEAKNLLTHEQQIKVLGEISRDIDTYRTRWENFCKEYDQDPMC